MLKEHSPLVGKKRYTLTLYIDDCSKDAAFGRPRNISKKLYMALASTKALAIKKGRTIIINMELLTDKKIKGINFNDYIMVSAKQLTSN